LYHESGLKALSETSRDMRVLEASSDIRVSFAIDYFVYRTALHAGMLAAALGGLDGFVFTGGIGENSVPPSFGMGARGLEGIVSKRVGSRYVSGRTRVWLKTKNPEFRGQCAPLESP
jgi:hypothetical protein